MNNEEKLVLTDVKALIVATDKLNVTYANIDKLLTDLAKDMTSISSVVEQHENMLSGDHENLGVARTMRLIFRTWMWLLVFATNIVTAIVTTYLIVRVLHLKP